jgi:hypothetical protein
MNGIHSQGRAQRRLNIAWERTKRAYRRRPDDKDSNSKFYLIVCGTCLIMAFLGMALGHWIF